MQETQSPTHPIAEDSVAIQKVDIPTITSSPEAETEGQMHEPQQAQKQPNGLATTATASFPWDNGLKRKEIETQEATLKENLKKTKDILENKLDQIKSQVEENSNDLSSLRSAFKTKYKVSPNQKDLENFKKEINKEKDSKISDIKKFFSEGSGLHRKQSTENLIETNEEWVASAINNVTDLSIKSLIDASVDSLIERIEKLNKINLEYHSIDQLIVHIAKLNTALTYCEAYGSCCITNEVCDNKHEKPLSISSGIKKKNLELKEYIKQQKELHSKQQTYITNIESIAPKLILEAQEQKERYQKEYQALVKENETLRGLETRHLELLVHCGPLISEIQSLELSFAAKTVLNTSDLSKETFELIYEPLKTNGESSKIKKNLLESKLPISERKKFNNAVQGPWWIRAMNYLIQFFYSLQGKQYNPKEKNYEHIFFHIMPSIINDKDIDPETKFNYLDNLCYNLDITSAKIQDFVSDYEKYAKKKKTHEENLEELTNLEKQIKEKKSSYQIRDDKFRAEFQIDSIEYDCKYSDSKIRIAEIAPAGPSCMP